MSEKAVSKNWYLVFLRTHSLLNQTLPKAAALLRLLSSLPPSFRILLSMQISSPFLSPLKGRDFSADILTLKQLSRIIRHCTNPAPPFCLVCGCGISSCSVLKYWLGSGKQEVLGCGNVPESYWRALEQRPLWRVRVLSLSNRADRMHQICLET